MKLRKYYRGPGYTISTAGLVVALTGFIMTRDFFVSADSATSGNMDFMLLAFFVGAIIAIVSIILMVLAFFGATSSK